MFSTCKYFFIFFFVFFFCISHDLPFPTSNMKAILDRRAKRTSKYFSQVASIFDEVRFLIDEALSSSDGIAVTFSLEGDHVEESKGENVSQEDVEKTAIQNEGNAAATNSNEKKDKQCYVSRFGKEWSKLRSFWTFSKTIDTRPHVRLESGTADPPSEIQQPEGPSTVENSTADQNRPDKLGQGLSSKEDNNVPFSQPRYHGVKEKPRKPALSSLKKDGKFENRSRRTIHRNNWYTKVSGIKSLSLKKSIVEVYDCLGDIHAGKQGKLPTVISIVMVDCRGGY